MAVKSAFRETSIEWMGETYVFTPANRLLRRIEGELAPSSISGVITLIGAGKPPISHIAFILASFLKAGGAEKGVADEDLIYAHLMDDITNKDATAYLAVVDFLMRVLSPTEDASKKPTADASALV